MPTGYPSAIFHHGWMHRVPQSLSPESTSLHRQNDPTSVDLIQVGVQQFKAQTACINAEAKALQAQAMRLHPAVRRREHQIGRAHV